MRCAALALALVLLGPARAGPCEEGPQVDGKTLSDHVKWLADDEREGRAAGQPGALAAAEYVAEHFRRLGLEPAGDESTYFQGFSLPRGFDIRPETGIEATRGSKSDSLVHEKEEVTPLSLSGAGDVTAPAVFCGYGISAPDLGYDDYLGVDVVGKVVVVLRHAPRQDDRKSPFAPPPAQRRHASFQAKVDTAVAAKAAALVVVNDPLACWKPKDDVLVQDVGGNPSSIPVMLVTYKAGRRLGKVLGLSFQREQKAIDGRSAPRSRLLEGVTLRVNAALEAKRLPVRNVCGRLPAAPGTTKSGEWLAVGGHFDHLGFGEYGSRAGSKGKGEVHNGADDNASGTAGVLEVASFLAARREALRRDVYFVLFTAEELGLHGSKHFVGAPPAPLAQCAAMVNLDMVGRLGRGRLQVGGTGTSPIFEELLDARNKRLRIKTRYNPGGQAPSDNAPFYDKGIPVLFFFTGLHSDYHRPDDDWKDVDKRGLVKVVQFAAEVCFDLASRDTRPPFVEAAGSAMATGPHLGLSIEQRADGVFVIYVEPGSPAAKARFRVGDKVEEFEGESIRTASDFGEVHSRAKPRTKVEITVRRGTRLLTLEPKLGRE